ncbi:hypothetical protein [Falsiroseomonas sp. HW251]|uniref:hypothetical protein n=1 Tax=Falsiroseomonas sp. HW251 TaxID=3390998 RepID=UPI003D3219DB
MTASGPIDSEVLRRMREVLVTAIASRSASLAEAAAEARGLGRGMQPALPASAIDAALNDILRSVGAYQAPPGPVEHDGRRLLPAAPEEVADALAYAMRFNERGKARRTGLEYASKLAAAELVRHLLASGFVLMRHSPAPHHSV